MFTKAYESWVKFYKFHKSSNPEKNARDLQVEMDEEVAFLKQAETAAAAILDVVAICDERIAFNEFLMALMQAKNVDISIFNDLIWYLYGQKTNFKTKMQAITTYSRLIENDLRSYRDIKNLCCENPYDQTLIDFIYYNAHARLIAERASMVKEQINNRNLEYFHFNRIVNILKPFLSPKSETFQQRFFTTQTRNLDSYPEFIRAIKQDIKLLKENIQTLKVTVESNKDFLSKNYRTQILHSLNDLVVELAPIEGTAVSIEKENSFLSNTESFTQTEKTLLSYDSNPFKTPTDRATVQKLDRSYKTSIAHLNNDIDNKSMVEIYGARNALNEVKKFQDAFFCLHEKTSEFQEIRKKILDSIEASKALKREQKFHKKTSGSKTPGNTPAMTSATHLTTSPDVTPTTRIHSAFGFEPNKGETTPALIKDVGQHNVEEEHLKREKTLIEAKKKEYNAWQTQREQDLLEYKNSILKGREFRRRLAIESTRIINAELNPGKKSNSTTSAATIVSTAANFVTAASQPDPTITLQLEDFEVQQLLFLNDQNPGLRDFLLQLQKRQLKYSELEKFVKKLSENLINPGKYPNFSLINPGPHFTMYIPNTNKLWERVETVFQLIPRQFSTLNSWRAVNGKHNVDDLSSFAVERCEAAFIRAGITIERLDMAVRMGSKLDNRQCN